MTKWRMTSILALGLLALPAAAMAQEQMAAEKMAAEQIHGEIEATMNEFVAALNGDDPGSAADYYTPDAVVMPPGTPAAKGTDAIREMFGPGMGGATLSLEIWDVHAAGADAALEVGAYEITGADGSHLDHGKYMAAWLRTDDGWKMAYDMWNSSMAPPETSHEEMHEKMHGDKTHDEVHEGEMEMEMEGGMDAMDTDDDGDAVPTADEDDEM